MLANDLNENKKDLKPGKEIAQARTHGVVTAFSASTQVPAWQSSQKKTSIKSKERQSSIRRLNKIKTEKIEAYNFLRQIKQAFRIKDISDSNYVENRINGKNYTLRLSNHCVNSYYSDKKSYEISIVIELSKHEFVNHKDRLVKEYVYYPENLTKDVKDNIIKGLTDWVNTGTYSYDQADEINMTDDMEKIEMRKAERARFVQNKLSEAGIDVVSDKNEFDTIISEKNDGKKMTQGRKIYGFSHQGKIYLNPEIATSETPLHEYTHLWDNYIQNTNRELWEKGKNILRNTKFWEEVKDDPNYAEIAEDEDLLLSEVHAQICGKMADAILAKIQEQDGELTKNTVIDWNNETWTYIVQEFGLENLWNNETKETLENLKEFLSRPMKDLFENTEKVNINEVLSKSISSDFEPNIGDSEKLSDSILEGEPIKSISTDDFNYDGSNLKEFALEYIRNNPQGIAITKIGEIEISEAGLRQSLSHTLYKNKLYSIPAIKDTLEKGTYLGVIKDLDGKRQNNYYFAAPILIDGQKDILFIRVKHVAGRNKLFYTHDIFTLDEIKKVTPYSGELNATQRSLRGATLAKSIIQDYEKNNIIQNDPLQFQRNGKQSNLRMTENKFKELNHAQDTTKTKGEEKTMEKEKIEVQTYKFQNGETIDEILSKQTSEWATDEECLDNMIDNSLREVADFADEKENELLKKISIAKNNPEVDLKLLAVQTDAAARYMAAKHYDDRLADIGKRPFSKDLINTYAQDDFPYELPSWMKDHLEEYPNQNVPEHTSEEEKAYQEWEEMLDDNQKAEEIIEKNQTKVPEMENEKHSEKLTDEYEADHKKENLFSTMHHTKDWTNDFPSVYSHSLYYGDSVNDKNYAENIKTALLVGKAKRGDRDAAIDLVNQSVRPEIIKELHEKYPDAIVCAVDGLEASGHNMIPIAYQDFLETQGFSVNNTIIQSAKAHHTGADNLDKLLNRVRFSGEVQKGKDYILLDDHISMGSTLRDLRDYIESNGGNVVAVTTLTAPKHDYKISISKENFEKLSVYGEPLNEFLREYGITDNIKGLTDREATEIIGLLSDRGRNPETQEGIRRSACLHAREIQENYLANLSGSLKKEALDKENPTIKNNNEKSQERHSDAKDYLIQTTRLFLSKLKEKNLPFLKGKERGPNIIIRPQAARDAATGKAFTGYPQLMAQALIQALYDQKKLPELEYDLITYDQAKACGTFIKKGSPHVTLTNYNRTTNSASKQMYYFKSGCNSPEMIDLHKESIARNRAIKRIRQSLENKEIPSERQTEEKNKITLLHYEEMTYLKALNKDTEQYFNSLTAEEKEMLKTLCSKEPLTQKTVRELAETLRKDRLISAQLSSQKNSGRSFDATECIVPEDFIGKAMAAASLGCSLETTQGTIDRITKDLHQTLSRNIEHYDYGKPFETGEIINGKCRNNVKDMCNKEYEAEELAKKIEQQQMALKKNPINALMELLNRNDLSDRTIGGYER